MHLDLENFLWAPSAHTPIRLAVYFTAGLRFSRLGLG